MYTITKEQLDQVKILLDNATFQNTRLGDVSPVVNILYSLPESKEEELQEKLNQANDQIAQYDDELKSKKK